MIRKLCSNFVNFICEDNYSNDDKEIMEYVLKVVIFEFLKMIGTLLIFYLLGYFLESLIIIAVNSFVKPFIGGYHSTTQLKCFLTTVIVNMAVIILSNNCSLNFISLIILITISYLAVYNQAPIINENIPLTKPDLIKKNRRKGLLNLFIISLLTIALYFFNSYYSYILAWNILFLGILMFNRLCYKDNFLQN